MIVPHLLTAAILVASVVQSTRGLSCACNPRQCPVVPTCPYGSGLDPCFCCTVCNLGPGDTCGGPFDIAGRCGEGLTCVKIRTGDLNLHGVCRVGSEGSISPHQPEQLKDTQQPLGSPQQPLGSPQQPLGSPQRPLGSPQRPLGSPQRPLGSPQRPFGAPHQPLSSDPYQPIHFPIVTE